MSSAAELMYKTRKELLLIGDFNQYMYTNFVENLLPNKNLVDFCHRFCFENKITEPTRVTDRAKSLLDVILVSHAEHYTTSGNLQLGLSDHDLVFVFRKNKLSRPKPRLIEYRSMKNFDNVEFQWPSWKTLLGARCVVSRMWTISGVTGALSIRTFLTGMRRSRTNGCTVINYPGSHLKFNTKLPGAIGCLNATGRTRLTISGLRISNSVIKSPH